MPTAETLRRLRSTHWVRIGMAAVVAAVVLTALFAMAGHGDVSITLQSALVHAVSMTMLVSLTLPRLAGALARRSTATRWTVKLTALAVLALVGTAPACGVITLLVVRPREPFWL